MSQIPQKILALVQVQSAWASKINWTAAVGAAAALLTILTGNKMNLDAGTQASIVTGIVMLQSVVTMVLRTKYTTTITPSSATSTPPDQLPIVQPKSQG